MQAARLDVQTLALHDAVPILKFEALVPVPLGVVMLTGPVVAPVGTVAVICVAELIAAADATPLNFTTVAPVKFVPVMTTLRSDERRVGMDGGTVGAADLVVKE